MKIMSKISSEEIPFHVNGKVINNYFNAYVASHFSYKAKSDLDKFVYIYLCKLLAEFKPFKF